MYFPYFRGKQYELITIRENAELLSGAGFIPIIEPVKKSITGLARAIDAVNDANGQAILIVNPHHGDHVHDSKTIERFFVEKLSDADNISAGILVTESVTVEDIEGICAQHEHRLVTLIHRGFTDARALADRFGPDNVNVQHVFHEEYCTSLYRKKFSHARRILLRDGFEKAKKNIEYVPLQSFSDLHVVYDEMNMNGFGDFLIVGDEFSTTGGPAYAVAIHLTFIDDDKDDEMFIYHFVSDSNDTTADPAGKFAEALTKLVGAVSAQDSKILSTGAIQEFIDLHKREHFPGLGYVKKLSMQHHLETLAEYFSR